MFLIDLLRTLNDNTYICIINSDTGDRTKLIKAGNLEWCMLKQYEHTRVISLTPNERTVHVSLTRKGGEG